VSPASNCASRGRAPGRPSMVRGPPSRRRKDDTEELLVRLRQPTAAHRGAASSILGGQPF
jgi:hypothetical protein